MSDTQHKKPWYSWWTIEDAGHHIGIKVALGAAAGVIVTLLMMVR